MMAAVAPRDTTRKGTAARTSGGVAANDNYSNAPIPPFSIR
jgi:hypothetical protein